MPPQYPAYPVPPVALPYPYDSAGSAAQALPYAAPPAPPPPLAEAAQRALGMLRPGMLQGSAALGIVGVVGLVVLGVVGVVALSVGGAGFSPRSEE